MRRHQLELFIIPQGSTVSLDRVTYVPTLWEEMSYPTPLRRLDPPQPSEALLMGSSSSDQTWCPPTTLSCRSSQIRLFVRLHRKIRLAVEIPVSTLFLKIRLKPQVLQTTSKIQWKNSCRFLSAWKDREALPAS